MLAVFAAVLALAGAPAGTPINCVTSIYGGNLGQTHGFTSIDVLDNLSCLAARYAAANRPQRDRIVRNHPNLEMTQVFATGMLVLLHEAEHIALQSTDECQVEKAAYRKVPILLKQFAPLLLWLTLPLATWYHLSLPASYRGC